MPVTAISDVIVPEVLGDQVSAKFPDMLVLGNSSIVDKDGEFPLGTPGTAFKIPFWKRIGSFGALTEGVAMTPGKITTGAEYAIVQRAGIALEVYDTADLVTKADPMGEISSQLAERAAQYLDAALVTALDKTPNVYNQFGNGAGTMTQDAIINALITTLGDNHQKLIGNGALIMHSKVYGDLMKLGVIQNVYQSGMDVLKSGIIPTILGLPIHISDRVTTATVSGAVRYNTYVAGPKALALFFQRGVQVETDRDILLLADVVSSNVHFAPHLYGWDDQGNAQAAEDAKSIHAVKIVSL
jgi:hypothetical protein